MEYRKDKRTKNLTLRDIHVGDWVQVWNKTTERYSPPRKITQICDDGTVYLEGSEEERPALWVENIKNVDALVITRELLKGFGFEITQRCSSDNDFNVLYGGHKICELYEFSDCNIIETTCSSFQYFHEFIGYMYDIYDMFPKTLKLERKGVQS